MLKQLSSRLPDNTERPRPTCGFFFAVIRSHLALNFFSSLALTLWIATPDVVAILTSNGDIYTWRHMINGGDSAVYFSYINQVAHGATLVRNLFTTESYPNLFLLPWYVIGIFARIFQLSPQLTFFVAKIASIWIAVPCILFFISWWYTEGNTRRVGLLTILFVKGASILILPIATFWPDITTVLYPLDFAVPESTTFGTLETSPHFTLSLLLYLFVIHGFLWYFRYRSHSWLIISAFAYGLLVSFHPFLVLPISSLCMATAVLYGLQKNNWKIVIIGLSVLHIAIIPAIASFLIATLQFPVFAQKIAIAEPMPFFLSLLVAYGILAPFLLHVYKRKSQWDTDTFFLLAWITCTIGWTFLPTSKPRRMLESAHIAIILLSLPVIVEYIRKKTLSTSLLLAIGFGSTLAYTLQEIITITQHSSYTYQTTEQEMIVSEAKKIAQKGDVLLAPPVWANTIPGNSGIRVAIGHQYETVDFTKKILDVQTVYSPTSSAQKKLNAATDLKSTLILLPSTSEVDTTFTQVLRTEKWVLYRISDETSPTVPADSARDLQ